MRSLFASNLINTITGPAATSTVTEKTDPEPELEPIDVGAWRAWAKGASPVGEPAPSNPVSPKRAIVAAKVPQG